LCQELLINIRAFFEKNMRLYATQHFVYKTACGQYWTYIFELFHQYFVRSIVRKRLTGRTTS